MGCTVGRFSTLCFGIYKARSSGTIGLNRTVNVKVYTKQLRNWLTLQMKNNQSVSRSPSSTTTRDCRRQSSLPISQKRLAGRQCSIHRIVLIWRHQNTTSSGLPSSICMRKFDNHDHMKIRFPSFLTLSFVLSGARTLKAFLRNGLLLSKSTVITLLMNGLFR